MKKLIVPKPWLLMFDIDDTLVKRNSASSVHYGNVRWQQTLKAVFGVDIEISISSKYNGWVDWQIGWDLLQPFHISEKEYTQKFPIVREQLYKQAVKQGKTGNELYIPIKDTVRLVKLLKITPGIYLGLLTGNLEKVGYWKLHQAGIDNLFDFGSFADNVQDRVSIAKAVIEKAKVKYNIDFLPNQIIVFGDTIQDIHCAKAIGAYSVGYTAGKVDSAQLLSDAGTDMVVEFLMAKELLKWLNLI
jgi:phosphoglycolate phosphatase